MNELESVRAELINKAVRYLAEMEGVKDAAPSSLKERKNWPALRSFYILQRGRDEKADLVIQSFLGIE